MNLKEFGVYFAHLREQSGYRSQRELADISGVSHSTINRIESGKHKVSPENLQILSQYLNGVTYEDLMYASGYLSTNAAFISQNKTHTSMFDKDIDMNEQIKFEPFINNPEHGIFFKEYLEAPEERKKELMMLWRILKDAEKGRELRNRQDE